MGRTLGPETTRDDLKIEGDDPWLSHEGSISEGELLALIGALSPEVGGQRAWFAVWSGYGFLGPGSSYLPDGGSIGQRFAVARIRLMERIGQRRARTARWRVPTFSLLHRSRSYFLFRGDLDDAIRFLREMRLHPPTLWWPEDRSWFVHTEIDAVSTYVGGSRALVDRLVGEKVLESLEVGADQPAAL